MVESILALVQLVQGAQWAVDFCKKPPKTELRGKLDLSPKMEEHKKLNNLDYSWSKPENVAQRIEEDGFRITVIDNTMFIVGKNELVLIERKNSD